MPRSDKTRQALDKKFLQYQRPEAPVLGEGQGDSGKAPNLNHAKGVPMTNNKRAPFKSKVIFDK